MPQWMGCSGPGHSRCIWQNGGPACFINTFHEFDLRPGGVWRLVMHGQEKGYYKNEFVLIIIEALDTIAWQRVSKPILQVVALLEGMGNDKTKVIFKMLFATAAVCDRFKNYVPKKKRREL